MDFNAIENNNWKLKDRSKIKEFRNHAIVFRYAINWDNQWLKGVYKQGSSLLKYLKKEYNIKSEVK